jgi:hypothetical protein
MGKALVRTGKQFGNASDAWVVFSVYRTFACCFRSYNLLTVAINSASVE